MKTVSNIVCIKYLKGLLRDRRLKNVLSWRGEQNSGTRTLPFTSRVDTEWGQLAGTKDKGRA